MNAPSIASGSLVPIDDRVEAERDAARRAAARNRSSLRGAAFVGLRARVRRTSDDLPVRGSAIGRPMPADGREALLPHRVLDDDGDDVPAVRDRLDPGARGRRDEEVGEHEDERARRQVAAQPRRGT